MNPKRTLVPRTKKLEDERTGRATQNRTAAAMKPSARLYRGEKNSQARHEEHNCQIKNQKGRSDLETTQREK
jgi:hypothetical protein